MASGAKVKGTGLKQTLDFVEKRYGSAKAREIHGKLPQEAQEAIRVALASAWYPVEYVGDLSAAIRESLAPDDPQIIFNVSKEAAKATFSGLYKMFFKLGSPNFILGRVTSVWDTLCSAGKLQVVEKGDKLVKVRLTEFPYKNQDYCEQRLRGWFQATLELSGCKILRSEHPVCTCKGDQYCEWIFTWR